MQPGVLHESPLFSDIRLKCDTPCDIDMDNTMAKATSNRPTTKIRVFSRRVRLFQAVEVNVVTFCNKNSQLFLAFLPRTYLF